LWSALRRIRPALHERGLRLTTAFQRWVPASASRLSKEALGLGVAALLGSELSEQQLLALHAAMSQNPDVGASIEEFIAAFSTCDGEGFEAFGHELLRRTGRALLRRTKGSISGGFATLDITGEGEVRLPGFRAAVLQFGDLNLNDEQVNKLWQLALVVGGCKHDVMDFVSFRKVFAPTPIEAEGEVPDPTRASRRDPGPSLEESCVHLHRLQRKDALRAAIFRYEPDVYLPFESLSAAVREAAPELSDDEVAQVCRLAPQKGGPMYGEDAYSYGHLLERLESERKDFHPLNPGERGPAADMCRYIDQRLQAQGFVSLAAALEDAEVVRADVLLDRLQSYLPQPIRPEDKRVVENLLRLGRRLRDGNISAIEFCQRFELLARSGAVAGSAPIAPVSPPDAPGATTTAIQKSTDRWRGCAWLRALSRRR